MKVTVQLFGPLAQSAGRASLEVEVAGSTVKDVVDAVAPTLKIDSSVRLAVNTDYAEPGTTLKDGDVVSLIPPVGGG